MDTLRLLLAILTATTVLGPICYALIVYREDLSTLFTPRIELTLNVPRIEYVGYEYGYEGELLKVTIALNITNPYNKVLTIRNVTGSVYCHKHGEFLGSLSLLEETVLQPNKPTTLKLIFVLLSDCERCRDATSLYVDLKNLSINVQGITFYIGYENIGPIALGRS
ncbi:MAG: hypothetical protein QXH19_05370 [Candidatus Bathyarchaeia archaeon]